MPTRLILLQLLLRLSSKLNAIRTINLYSSVISASTYHHRPSLFLSETLPLNNAQHQRHQARFRSTTSSKLNTKDINPASVNQHHLSSTPKVSTLLPLNNITKAQHQRYQARFRLTTSPKLNTNDINPAFS